MLGIVCVAFICIGGGLLQLFAPDLMWSWQNINNKLEGRASERTEMWEIGRSVSGVILIIVGIVFGLWGWSETSATAASDARATQAAIDRADAKITTVSELDAAFGAVITALREPATTTPQQIRVSTLGLPNAPRASVVFGRCEGSGDLYVIVPDYLMNGTTRHFVYTTGNSLCRIPRLYIADTDLLDRSEFGGSWFEIPMFTNYLNIATAVYAPLRTPTPDVTAAPGD